MQLIIPLLAPASQSNDTVRKTRQQAEFDERNTDTISMLIDRLYRPLALLEIVAFKIVGGWI